MGLLITAFTWLCSYPVDFAIPIVIVWALIGVWLGLGGQPKQTNLDEFTTRQIIGVEYGVLAGLCLVSFGIIVKVLYVLLEQRPEALKNKNTQEEEEEEEHEQGTSGLELVSES